MTLSKAEALERRLKDWKTKPISLFLTNANSSSERPFTTCELRIYSPLVGVSNSPIIFIIVDLPLPEGPVIAIKSPFSTLKVTPLSTGVTISRLTYSFTIFLNSIAKVFFMKVILHHAFAQVRDQVQLCLLGKGLK